MKIRLHIKLLLQPLLKQKYMRWLTGPDFCAICCCYLPWGFRTNKNCSLPDTHCIELIPCEWGEDTHPLFKKK